MIHVDPDDTVAAPRLSSAPSRRNNKWGNEVRRKSGRRRGSQELARHDPRPATHLVPSQTRDMWRGEILLQ